MGRADRRSRTMAPVAVSFFPGQTLGREEVAEDGGTALGRHLVLGGGLAGLLQRQLHVVQVKRVARIGQRQVEGGEIQVLLLGSHVSHIPIKIGEYDISFPSSAWERPGRKLCFPSGRSREA